MLLLRVSLGDVVRDLGHRFVIHFGQQVQVFANDLDSPRALLASLPDGIAPAQKVAPLSPNGHDVDVLVLK